MAEFTRIAAVALPHGWEAWSWALDALSVGLLAYWGVALVRVRAMRRTIPTARDGLTLPEAGSPGASVCIIVAAHNEEAAIETLVRSVRRQDYPRLSAVLCLDRCTDGTASAARAAIADDARVRIVEIATCPRDWAGKVNALWQGAQTPEARAADLLLFIDADTELDPGCVRASVALLDHRTLDLLSLLSTLSCDRWFERVVQPAAGFELMRQYPITRANLRRGPRAFANGQFLLFRREAYTALGGHAAVHDELLEDIALARLAAEAARPCGLFIADGMIRCRMYSSWRDFQDGWKRIYIEGAKRKVMRLRRSGFVAVMSGCVMPLGATAGLIYSLTLFGVDEPTGRTRLAGIIGAGLAVMGLSAWLSVMVMAFRIARASLWTIALYPIGAWIVGRILAHAASDLRDHVPVRWAGREYVREPR